jgi:pimeloyl-ACP methyl ester carboxylesterase
VEVLAAVLAVLALGVLYQQVGLRRDARRFPPPGLLIDAGGHRLHAVSRGPDAGPAVLLEAAIAASSISWSVVQREVAGFARVVANDRAGLGWSDAPRSPRTVDRILDELSAVVAHAGGPRVVLVGHSFGSLVIRAFAARRPGAVAGLVLVDPPTDWLTLTPARVRMLRGGRHLSRIGSVLARLGVVRLCLALLTGGAPGVPRRVARIFGPTASQTLERIVGEIRKLPPDLHPVIQALWCRPKCFHAMASHFAVLEREARALAACVPPSDIPVVVLSSAGQTPDRMAEQRRLAEASTSGRHRVAARSGHWVQFDEPELVVAAVRELVEAEGRAGAAARAAPTR